MARDVCREKAPPLFELREGHTARCWNFEDREVRA